MINEPVKLVGEALLHLSGIRENFRRNYRQMLWQVLEINLPVAVCTIYNVIPGLGEMEKTALALFNETILQEAFAARVPVVDLHLICNEVDDYSLLSPIEPSHSGGRKIAQAIRHLLEVYNFASEQSSIISASSAPTQCKQITDLTA